MYLDQAKQLFAEFGYASTSYEQIVEACGVTHSVLTRSFRDKSTFLKAIGDDWLTALFPPEPADSPATDVVHQLQEVTSRFLEVTATDRQAAGILLAGLAEPGDPDESKIVHEVVQSAVERLAPFVQAGQQAGVIRRGLDPAATAADWMRFLLGAALLRPPDPPEGEAHTHVIDTLLHGVLKTDV